MVFFTVSIRPTTWKTGSGQQILSSAFYLKIMQDKAKQIKTFPQNSTKYNKQKNDSII